MLATGHAGVTKLYIYLHMRFQGRSRQFTSGTVSHWSPEIDYPNNDDTRA
jgi:hypothetical protein